ncbi:S8 family serine peptidase [Streptomyces sp. WAC 04229]|uniref:S8 family serine peptidase n=1 Tax=Streptomyces sp. WAC 04229 TaxID=2203206 RepID=UPI003D763182
MPNSPRRSVRIGLTAAVLGGLLTAVPGAAADDASASGTPGRPQRVIVELDGAGALEAAPGSGRSAEPADVAAERKAVSDQQADFLTDAKDAGVEAKSVRKHDLLLNAVSMTVDPSDAAALAKLPGVRSVTAAGVFRAQDVDAQEVVGVPKVWERKDPTGTRATGKGVTVAVLDSGIDYTHPDLGGGFGEGHKVVGGYDFVNDDEDPMDDHSHGTHVAGIIAAKAAGEGGVTGAAPDARLLAYKVLGADGSGEDADIIAALEAAVDPANPHRADIINMSLGNTMGHGDDPVARAAAKAVEAGAIVFASAGNTGPGYYSVGSPAAAPGVIAVGASTSGVRRPVVEVDGGEQLITYRGGRSANPPTEPVTAPMVDVGMGTPEDWERVGDVKGKVVLTPIPPSVNPNEVWAEELALWREAEKQGAVAVVGGVSAAGGGPVAMNGRTRTNPLDERQETGDRQNGERRGEFLAGANAATPAESGDSLRMDKLPVIGVGMEQGRQLARLAETGARLVVGSTDATDQMASFSSRGPDRELDLKPEIVAPGVEIRSTVPKSIVPGGVLRQSGTSMASPLAAGSAALLHQLHPQRTPAQIGAQLIGSVDPLSGPDTQAQGNGRLDTAAAAGTDLSASPPTVSFRLPHMDGEKVTGTRTVTVHNAGNKAVTGKVSVSGPATVSPKRVTIPAGGTAEVRLKVERELPDITDAASSYLSGRVTVTPDKGGKIAVPYLMAALPLHVDAAVDPTTDGDTTVYVYSPTSLNAAPKLKVDPPRGRDFTVATRATSDPYYYQADLTGLRDGVHAMTVDTTTAAGVRQHGSGAFEVTTKQAGGKKKWQPIGPNSAAGTTQLVPGKPTQAVMTQGTRSGGAWLTTDSGRTWQPMNNTPVSNLKREPSLVIDPDDPEHWWQAVRSDHPSAFPAGGALLETRDRGKTWQRMNAPQLPWTELSADPEAKTLLAEAATEDRYVSTDRGTSWQRIDLAEHGIEGRVADTRFGGDDLYLWAGQVIWVIRDFATGHDSPAQKVFEGKTGETHLGGFDVHGDLLAIKAQGKRNGLWISRDGGRTVEKSSRGFSGLFDVQGGGIYHDDLSGTGAVSRDGGRTWTEVEQPVRGTVVTDYDRWGDGSYTIGDSTGLYRSTDDGGYRRLGVQGSSVPELTTAGDVLLAGDHRTELPVRSPEWDAQDEGTIGGSITGLVAPLKDPKQVWRVRGDLMGSHVEKSSDAGRTWQEISALEGGATAFLVDPADPDRMVVSYARQDGAGVHSTTDGGRTWKTVPHGRSYQELVADPNVRGRIWLAGYWGLAYSDDMGTTVTQVADHEVDSIVFHGKKMITGGTAIRHSTDGGKTFTKADTGDLRIQVSDLLAVDGTLYAGTTTRWRDFTPHAGRGVLRSTDGGRSWENISRSMPNNDVLSLAATRNGEALFVGTEQGGVYRLELDR